MASTDPFTKLARAGLAALDRLRLYHRFAEETLAKYENMSGDGPLPPAAGYLKKEIEQIWPAIAAPFEFNTLTGPTLGPGERQGLDRQQQLFAEVAQFYARDGNHRVVIREALTGAHGLTKSEADRIGRAPDRITRAITAFDNALREAIAASAAALATPPLPGPIDPAVVIPGPGGDGGSSGGGDGGNSQGDDSMSNGNSNEDALNAIVDAISRLQGGGGVIGAAGVAGTNAFRAFDYQLSQKLMQRGFPDLSSDGSLAAGAESLADKVFDALDRSIATESEGGVESYVFNPLLARGAQIGGEGTALGAQGVAAETIRNLKAPLMTNVYKLTSESVIGEQDEADDLRKAIDEGIDKLIEEASSERGVFVAWLREILNTIFQDLISLADLYDIRDPGGRQGLAPVSIALTDLTGQSIQQILFAVDIEPAVDRLLRDPDIGILTAETNDRALAAILSKLLLMALLLGVSPGLGPILGRVRALNDAISASVLAAQTALAAAGVSEGDQVITFSDDDLGSIDLARLLDWIKSESITSRPTLLREDLNPSDLRRVRAARATQLQATEAFLADANFPTINPNDFALGRRQLEEVRQHLANIVDLMDQLISRGSGGVT